ncbi:hypothetical protein AB0F88_34820 [Streptosporangium sp. NPDC023963]
MRRGSHPGQARAHPLQDLVACGVAEQREPVVEQIWARDLT